MWALAAAQGRGVARSDMRCKEALSAVERTEPQRWVAWSVVAHAALAALLAEYMVLRAEVVGRAEIAHMGLPQRVGLSLGNEQTRQALPRTIVMMQSVGHPSLN